MHQTEMQILRHRRDRRHVMQAINHQRRIRALRAMTELSGLLRDTEAEPA